MYNTTPLNAYPPEMGWSLSQTTTPPLLSTEDAESASSLNSPLSLHPNGPMLNNSGQDEHIEREAYVLNEKTVTPDQLTTKESAITTTDEDMSKLACEHEVFYHSCNNSNSNSPDSHESLHVVARRESLHNDNDSDSVLYPKNDQAFCGGDGDNFTAIIAVGNATNVQPPSSIIEMQPIRGVNPGSQSSKPCDDVIVTEPLSPPRANKQNAQLNSSLLQDAMCDLSPHAAAALLGNSETTLSSRSTEVVRVSRGKKGNSSLVLGVDGIPCQLESVHLRLRELNFKHQREVRELERTLREVRLQVAAAVTKVEDGGVEVEWGGGEELSDGEMQSPNDKVCLLNHMHAHIHTHTHK